METALARAALYNIFAAAFGDPPTPELLAAASSLLPEWRSVAPASLDELRRAYTRLLVGPGAGYAPPYASLYIDPPVAGKPQLWGREAETVEARYREAGLEVAPGQPRVPDHLALELQFMQHLCAREADAELRGEPSEAAAWRLRQRDFLQAHLEPWLPRFVARLSAVNAHPFYRALAEFTRALVQAEIAAEQLSLDL
jgi:TorA maturation chaperone TorD